MKWKPIQLIEHKVNIKFRETAKQSFGPKVNSHLYIWLSLRLV